MSWVVVVRVRRNGSHLKLRYLLYLCFFRNILTSNDMFINQWIQYQNKSVYVRCSKWKGVESPHFILHCLNRLFDFSAKFNSEASLDCWLNTSCIFKTKQIKKVPKTVQKWGRYKTPTNAVKQNVFTCVLHVFTWILIPANII